MVRIDTNPSTTQRTGQTPTPTQGGTESPRKRGVRDFGELLDGPNRNLSQDSGHRSTLHEGIDDSPNDGTNPATDPGTSARELSSTRNDDSSPKSQAGPKADLQNLLHRLVHSFRIGQNRSGAMEVRMELKNTIFDGMQIQLAKGANGLKAVLTVERYAAKGALEGQVAELTKRLQSQGIEVSDIQVELARTPQDPDPEGSSDDGNTSDPAPESLRFGTDGPAGTPPGARHARTNSRASRSIQSPTDYSL